MQTREHEHQGTICNTACPAMASNVLKTFNTVNLLTEMQMLSYILSNMRQHSQSLSDIVCKMPLGIINTWALKPVLNWTVFRNDCMVLLEGRGNRDQRSALDLALYFRIQTFSL
jgi:hypothetical protein